MRISRKIDIHNYQQIQKELNDFVSTLEIENCNGVFANVGDINIHEQVSRIIPLVSAIVNLGLFRYWSYTVIVVSSYDIGIHRDEGLCSTLLLPVRNTQGSKTTFYHTDEEPELRYQENGIPYYYYHTNRFDPLYSIEIDSPTLMDVSVPHGVTVGQNVPRVTLSLRFDDQSDNIIGSLCR
jgi:hypothetical protein